MGLPTKKDVIGAVQINKQTVDTEPNEEKQTVIVNDTKTEIPNSLLLQQLKEEHVESQLVSKHITAIQIKNVRELAKYQVKDAEQVLYSYNPDTKVALVLPREICEKRNKARIALGK